MNDRQLRRFLKENRRVALAFSGGTDSAYLMYAACRAGVDITAYFVKSQFQPEFELKNAERIADELGCPLRIIDVDIFKHDEIVCNAKDRCYHCKRLMFEAITAAAKTDGYTSIADGTNASDDAAERPGMRVLTELGIISPLKLCGIAKEDVRRLSAEAGLWTFDMPSYSCLATRIKTGEKITEGKLEAVEKSEEYLGKLGLRDFRLRVSNSRAALELRSDDRSIVDSHRSDIEEYLGNFYEDVDLGTEDNNEQRY